MNPNPPITEDEKRVTVDEPEEHIHMPNPSWSPIMLALGLAAAAFGVVLGGAILIVGVIILAAGLGTWIYDEIKHAASADAEEASAESSDAGLHSAT